MKKIKILFTLIFLSITVSNLAIATVYPFDQENLESIFDSSLGGVHQPKVEQSFDVEFDQNNRKKILTMQQDNETARRKQFLFSGFASVIRAVALIQIADAQYRNYFGQALQLVALIRIVYGMSLIIEPIYSYCLQKKEDVEDLDMFQRESEISTAKNYAVTGLGSCLGGIEGILFSLAAPHDPLSPFTLLFGAQQCFVGLASSSYSAYSILKTVPYCVKFLPNENSAFKALSLEEIVLLNQKKLERSRLQQFFNIGIWHIVRGGSTYSLQKHLPSQIESALLILFGSAELIYGGCALYDPLKGCYQYYKGIKNNTHTLEEGSRKFYILRALSMISIAPVNMIYTLGVPDAKTPWIVGVSILSVLVGVYSGWNPICDYYGLDSYKCKKGG
ncbi:MAG: hypothetical protein C0432_01880 [Candidatus Puniceispirillum sp.]|nr:hypothetical protein [Candidatus Pelagibacter sp.]MBA4283025.1 hypothetical protein [Candidatus Puniceispirillum sp.]